MTYIFCKWFKCLIILTGSMCKADTPENWHLNVKKFPKLTIFQKNCQKLSMFLKKCQVFDNFLTFKCQFSGGSGVKYTLFYHRSVMSCICWFVFIPIIFVPYDCPWLYFSRAIFNVLVVLLICSLKWSGCVVPKSGCLLNVINVCDFCLSWYS